jgi:hypothetical protein
MAKIHGMIAVIGALVLASVAAGAHAADKARPSLPAKDQAFTVDPSVWAPSDTRRSMQWIGNGRWGLDLDFSQPVNREMEGKDLNIGPTYKVTKRVQIRGAVNLGDQTAPRVITPDEKPQPRVRLETLFRF